MAAGGRGKKALLIRPPCEANRVFGGIWKPQPPMNLLSMATFLESKGVRTRIIDLELPGAPDIREEIGKFRPDLAGVGFSSVSLSGAIEACRRVKETGTACVVGGPHPTALPEETLAACRADAAIIGEGEETIYELLTRRRWLGVKGIAVRKGGRIIRTPPRPLQRDLDRLPFPRRRLMDMRAYDDSASPGIIRRTAFVIASRGCPYGCYFCQSSLVLGRRWRARSVGHVISELEDIADLGYGHVRFDDDIFGFRRDWLEEFCGRMRKSGLAGRLSWSCNVRVDTVPPAGFRMMREAGCVKVCMGLESGSQKVLDRMGKGTTPAMAVEAFRAAKKAGIMTQAYVILGMPGETARDVALTRKALLEADPDFAHISVLAPLPATPAHEEAVREGRLRQGGGFGNRGYFTPPACGNGIFSAEELDGMRKALYRDFYFRPAYILRRARSAAMRPAELLYDIRSLAALVRMISSGRARQY